MTAWITRRLPLRVERGSKQYLRRRNLFLGGWLIGSMLFIVPPLGVALLLGVIIRVVVKSGQRQAAAAAEARLEEDPQARWARLQRAGW